MLEAGRTGPDGNLTFGCSAGRDSQIDLDTQCGIHSRSRGLGHMCQGESQVDSQGQTLEKLLWDFY